MLSGVCVCEIESHHTSKMMRLESNQGSEKVDVRLESRSMKNFSFKSVPCWEMAYIWVWEKHGEL